MAIISYKEYKIENDENYFAKNNMLLEMAQIGDKPRIPINFDDDDLEFLVQFPTSYWGMALHERYDTFLRNALFERCKQRLAAEIAIFNEIEKITEEFIKKIEEKYANGYESYKIHKDSASDYQKDAQKKHLAELSRITEEIGINFESIKNLPETINLKIKDEDLNFIDKEILPKWFNDVVAIKINKEEKLRPEQLNGMVQTFQAFEKKPNSENFEGTIELSGHKFPFSLGGMKSFFIEPNGLTPNINEQKWIKNIKYLNDKNQIEVEYYPEIEGKKSIQNTVAKVSYNYNSYDQEAVENFAQLETYNLIKKYIPFPVKTNEYDPDPPEKDVYEFKRQPSGKENYKTKVEYGKIGAKSFIIRLIAKLEQDENEPHFEGSGLEGSKGEYGYDLSGGYTKGIISCTNENGKYEFYNFTLPKQITFETAVREFLDANHHGVHDDAHEFKNYQDCLGKIKNNIFERSFDIVILAEYHIKHLNENKIDIVNIEKFIKSEEDDVKKMREELKEKYGQKRYLDSLLKIKKLIELYAKSVDPTKTTEEKNSHKEEMKNMAVSDKSIKNLFKFADPDLPIKYAPVKGLKNTDLKGDHNYKQIVDSTTNACESALKKSISTGNEETINVRYNDHGQETIEPYTIYPMDQWEELNVPSKTGKKNIFIQKEYKTMKVSTESQLEMKAKVGVYLTSYVENKKNEPTDEIETSQSENEAQKSLANFTQFFAPYAKQIANNIVNGLIKNKKITVPFNRKHETIYHPAKSKIKHPKHYGQISNRSDSDLPENLISKGITGNKEVFYSKGENKKPSLSRIKKEQIEFSTIEGEITIIFSIDMVERIRKYNFQWYKNKINILPPQVFIESIYLIDAGEKGTELVVAYTPEGIEDCKITKLNIRYDYNTEEEDIKNKVFLGGNIVLATQERPINWIEKGKANLSNDVALVHPSKPYIRLLPKLTEKEEKEKEELARSKKDDATETIEENKETFEDEEVKSLDDQIKTNDIEKLVKDTVKGTIADDSEEDNLDYIRIGHNRDHRRANEKSRSGNELGHGAGGINLNKNNPKQKTHLKKTPKQFKEREAINEREDMRYELTNSSKYLNNLINIGFKNDYVKTIDDSSTTEPIEAITQGQHYIRPAIGAALGLVYNKWGKSKIGGNLTKSGKKIIKCFIAFIEHCEDEINNNLREPIVSYKETDDEEENKKNKGKFISWLAWKILSAIQKSEIKDCKTPWTRRKTNDFSIKSIGQESENDGKVDPKDMGTSLSTNRGEDDKKNKTDNIAKKNTEDRARNSEIYRNLVVDQFKKDMKAYINPKIQDSKEIYLIKKSKVIELMKEFKEIYNLNLDGIPPYLHNMIAKDSENGIPPYLHNMIAKDSEIKKMIKKIFDESEEREKFIISILGEKPTGFEPTGNEPTKKTYTTATGIERNLDDFVEPEIDYTNYTKTTSPTTTTTTTANPKKSIRDYAKKDKN